MAIVAIIWKPAFTGPFPWGVICCYVSLFQGAAVTIQVIERITILFKYKGFKAIKNSRIRTSEHERAYYKSYHIILEVTRLRDTCVCFAGMDLRDR